MHTANVCDGFEATAAEPEPTGKRKPANDDTQFMATTGIVGTLFLVFGTALFLGVGWLLVLARRSQHWASTRGRVVSSKIDSTFDTTGSNRMSHRLILAYRYTVDGDTLTGDRLQFGDTFWSSTRSRDLAEKLGRKYPEGQEVTVYCDPAHPDRCTLTRNVESKPYFLLFAVALGLVAAGWAVLAGLVRVL